MIAGLIDRVLWLQVRWAICSSFYELHWLIAAIQLAVADIFDLDHISTDIASVDFTYVCHFYQFPFLLVTV